MFELSGYDIDGVLTVGIVPVEPFVIISGRVWGEDSEIVRTLSFQMERIPYSMKALGIYLRGSGTYGDRETSGMFKAMMINHLQVSTFYEDDELQISLIQQFAPGCKVRQVSLNLGVPIVE